jgi:serine-type D-Ala-D-Ala carboxypeptidase (penicillin-binding protein 5/6)
LQVYLGDRLIGRVPLTVQDSSPASTPGRTRSFWDHVWEIMAGGMWSA